MNIDTLKHAWQADTAEHPSAAEVERAARASRANARRYQRDARLRLVSGIAAFVLATAFFIALASLPQVWIGMRFALLLWSASILACGIALWRTRAGTRIVADVALAVGLHRSLQRIRREIAWQHSLRWWFWVPCGIGIVAALSWNPPVPPGSHPFMLLSTAALWIWGTISAPRHGSRRLRAEALQLQTLLDSPGAATKIADGETA